MSAEWYNFQMYALSMNINDAVLVSEEALTNSNTAIVTSNQALANSVNATPNFNSTTSIISDTIDTQQDLVSEIIYPVPDDTVNYNAVVNFTVTLRNDENQDLNLILYLTITGDSPTTLTIPNTILKNHTHTISSTYGAQVQSSDGKNIQFTLTGQTDALSVKVDYVYMLYTVYKTDIATVPAIPV